MIHAQDDGCEDAPKKALLGQQQQHQNHQHHLMWTNTTTSEQGSLCRSAMVTPLGTRNHTSHPVCVSLFVISWMLMSLCLSLTALFCEVSYEPFLIKETHQQRQSLTGTNNWRWGVQIHGPWDFAQYLGRCTLLIDHLWNGSGIQNKGGWIGPSMKIPTHWKWLRTKRKSREYDQLIFLSKVASFVPLLPISWIKAPMSDESFSCFCGSRFCRHR